ncbi:hypothetical protein [Methylobacterium gregans]|uniref:Uncharacterized protein n=1 Tax=Methylobacterium gregans TaxID=374424 RepID=A0AA37MEH9_9HYPH|nr:hypothetical protein [Methylobacterium gregans]MDQ0521671.1 hypothetical protein [Methylobacterium gregans]GJD80988.1 hypothetical protein NBEOAGPD_4233 [Methylobacterium gregans]
MKTALLGSLAVLALVSAAEARPRAKADAEAVLAPLRQAATDCFAETVMANPGAMNHARAGRWYQAAGVIGFLCRPEVDAMVLAHDRAYGPGTGDRYFKGAYARHLDQQLAARVQPLLERKAVASAEPPAEKAPAEDAGEP